MRDTFRAEALCSSALAAPAMALAALDPRIVHSFQVHDLMVVSQFRAKPPIAGLTVAELRDRHGALALTVHRPDGVEACNPQGELTVRTGDVVTLQFEYSAYQRLRELTGEARPPVMPRRPDPLGAASTQGQLARSPFGSVPLKRTTAR